MINLKSLFISVTLLYILFLHVQCDQIRLRPKTMEITMPEIKDTPDSTAIPDSVLLTLILVGEDKVYYYPGKDSDSMQVTDLSSNGIRKILLERNELQINKTNALKQQIETRQISRDKYEEEMKQLKRIGLMVMIKATKDVKIDSVVQVLDELLLAKVARYAIVDIRPEEEKVINEKENAG